ncbi:hypothetical protein [Candidatus Entotheonella palauensis]|uniref:DUF4124 domain-containing protein n=1 Tax=Candidatus Entotheonella gemina TaxID=1429439 RepID=W4LGB6_9BACT|nr:hypothetical protein [Candidatus Entotheonella palauensis]ETW97047.1 MAG: hypothetical protein ETSY2_45290 [Candidatus Entotheonella gemina]
MQKRRLGLIAAGVLITASIWVAPALADMFYYRDAQGQLHLTNVWTRIPPAYRSQAARNRRPEQGGPAQVAGKMAKLVPAPSPKPLKEETLIQRAATASPHAAPVNARDFGLLSLRMSDFEVLQRLGPPAAINDVGENALASAGRRNRTIRITNSNQSWYYPGTARTPATRLEFQGGVLVSKKRLHR